MIKENRNIPGVRTFIKQINSSDFLFLNTGKLLCYYNNGRIEELLGDKVEVVEEWRDGYLINENKFYSEGEINSILDENTFKSLIIDDSQLFIKQIDYEREAIQYGVFNFPSKKINWIINFGGAQPQFCIEKDVLISKNDDHINFYSFDKGYLWQQSYQSLSGHENAFLHSRILHHSGKLFFVISGNENKGLYVLDVNTGELLKKYLDLGFEIYLDGDYIFASAYDNILCRINAHTLELEQWDCKELIKSNGFNSIHDHRMCALNNIFYFTQSLGGKNAKLGVLDWGKKELVYQHDFEKSSGAIGSIQATPDRIFVHAQDNTLHIFEKDDEK